MLNAVDWASLDIDFRRGLENTKQNRTELVGQKQIYDTRDAEATLKGLDAPHFGTPRIN